MEITLQAKDWVIAIMALIGAGLSAIAVLAILVRVLGRRVADIEEDAAGWRARYARKEELATATPRLEMTPVVEAE